MTLITMKESNYYEFTQCIHFDSYSDNPVLLYFKETEQIGVISWLLVPLLICIDPLCGQYTITPDPQPFTIHADPVIFEPLNQIKFNRSTNKVTSYVDFTPYLHSFNKFETYLLNVTNHLKSPNVLAHFHEADTTHIGLRKI